MSGRERLELTILGQTLTLRSEASPEYLRRLAAYLEERVATLRGTGVKDPMTALLLAALDITDELFRARETRTRDVGEVGARLGALVALLERATRETPPRAP